MKTYDPLREYRYNKAVARFCALGLFVLVVVVCVMH